MSTWAIIISTGLNAYRQSFSSDVGVHEHKKYSTYTVYIHTYCVHIVNLEKLFLLYTTYLIVAVAQYGCR